MSLSWPSKDPGERLDYVLNWVAPLQLDVIVTSTWTISDPGLITTLNTHTANTTTIWLSGGTANTQYQVTNTITTTAGRVFDQTVNIRVANN